MTVQNQTYLRAILYFSALFFFLKSGWAQQHSIPTCVFDEPRFEHFTTTDGLASRHIKCIAQDSMGYLWIGGEDGLSRFDGVHFRNFYKNIGSPNGLNSSVVNCLYVGKDGLVWIGTAGGLNCFDPKTDRICQFNPDGADSLHTPVNIGWIHEDGDGETIWIGIGWLEPPHTLCALDRRTWTFTNYEWPEKKFGSDSKTTISMVVDRSDPNRLIMAGWDLIMYFDKKTRQFSDPGLKIGKIYGEGYYRFHHIFQARNGLLWLLGHDFGLICIDPRTHHVEKIIKPASFLNLPNGVICFKTVSEEELLVPGHRNLFLLNTETREQVKQLSLANVSGDIWAMMGDRNGSFWIGTTTGLFHFSNRLNLFHHLKYVYKNSWGDWHDYGDVWDAADYPQGNQIITVNRSPQHLTVFHPETNESFFVNYPQKTSLDQAGDHGFSRILIDQQSRVWLVHVGLFRYDHKSRKIRRFHHPKLDALGIQNCYFRTIEQDQEGNIYAADREYLFFFNFEKNIFRRINWPDLPLDKKVERTFNRPCFAPNGKVFFGTKSDLVEWDIKIDKWRSYQLPPELNLTTEVYPVGPALDKNGNFWIACHRKGMAKACIIGDSLHILKRYDAPFGSLRATAFWHCMADRDGIIWVATTNGLARIDPETDNVLMLNERWGLDEPDCNERIFEQAADGRILFTAGQKRERRQNLHWFDPRDLVLEERPPNVLLEHLSVLENPLQMDTALAFRKVIHLRHFENFFDIKFTTITFFNADSLQFSYKLDDFQDNWSQPSTNRTAAFTNVPPGRYTFMVKARTPNGFWSERPTQVEIIIAPAFYQTWWFRLLLTALTLGFVGFATAFYYRFRLRAQQLAIEKKLREAERNELLLQSTLALQHERDRIAAEMHDELGGGLSTIRLASERAKKIESPEETQAVLARVSQIAIGLVGNMRGIVWAMDTQNDSLDSLLSYLRQYAHQFLADNALVAHIEMPDEIPDIPLSGQYRHNVLLTLKECLNNVVKHAEASEVWLSAKIEDGELRITLRDNGKGFDPKQAVGKGKGLRSVFKRMESIGGSIRWEEREQPAYVEILTGKGTVVLLDAPLRN
ncbi:MAG: two-component regulator propeller domain-containing protein [Saprospiraceae bacterium]